MHWQFSSVYKFLYIRVVLFSIFCAFWHARNFARFFLKSQNNLGYGPNNTLGSPLKRHIQNLKISRSAQIYAYCTFKYNNKFKPTAQILLIFNFADPNRCFCKNRYLATFSCVFQMIKSEDLRKLPKHIHIVESSEGRIWIFSTLDLTHLRLWLTV